MPFPGTPVLSTEILPPLNVALSNSTAIAAPNNEKPIDDTPTGSAFSANFSPPVIGLAVNSFGFWSYGVNRDNYAINQVGPWPFGATGYVEANIAINGGYFYAVDMVNAPTGIGTIGLLYRAISVTDFSGDNTIVAPDLTSLQKNFTISLGNSNQPTPNLITQKSNFDPLNPSAMMVFSINLFEPDFYYEYVAEIFSDNSDPILYNGMPWPIDVYWDTRYCVTNSEGYIYRWLELYDETNNIYAPAIVRIKPEIFVIDGGGIHTYDVFMVSIDNPVIQAIFDAYAINFEYVGMKISASPEGWLISYLDGAIYKLILMSLNGDTYRHIDFSASDLSTQIMIDNLNAGIFPLGQFPKVSNFQIYGGYLYFTCDEPQINNISAGLLSASIATPSKTGNPIRVSLPCQNPCIPFIVEK